MTFDFRDLAHLTRVLMVEELDLDQRGAGRLCVSPRLTERGRLDWPLLLRVALGQRDSDWLAAELGRHARLHETELRPGADPLSPPLLVRVPVNAAELLAGGEVNRYYARAVCRRALQERGPLAVVQIYRAKAVRQERSTSGQRVGTLLAAGAVLDDLRRHTSEDVPALGVPSGPGSGLSVRLPRAPGG